jgi:hypothetical protein
MATLTKMTNKIITASMVLVVGDFDFSSLMFARFLPCRLISNDLTAIYFSDRDSLTDIENFMHANKRLGIIKVQCLVNG